ncbi:MAG TPA: hypothetical protein VFZ18_01270, partial [Longimicrobiaceae bacterium]
MSTHSRRLARLSTLAALALLAPSDSAAQGLPWGLGAGFGYETYDFADTDAVGMERLSLWTVPLVAHLEPARWLDLDVDGAYAEGELVR